MSRHDQWLTTDHEYEARSASADELDDVWEKFCEKTGVPYEANELDHVDHQIYVAWEALMEAMNSRLQRIAAEAEYEEYVQDRDYEKAFKQGFNEGRE